MFVRIVWLCMYKELNNSFKDKMAAFSCLFISLTEFMETNFALRNFLKLSGADRLTGIHTGMI